MVAGILAAAQSTISTSMNSVSTVIVTDWYRRLRGDRADAHYLAVGRVLTVLLGIIGTATALWFASMESRSLLDAFLRYVGLLTSVLGGLFLLGITSRRANSASALFGAAVGAGVLILVAQSELHFFLYAGVGMLTTVVVGSLVAPWMPGAATADGLTIRT